MMYKDNEIKAMQAKGKKKEQQQKFWVTGATASVSLMLNYGDSHKESKIKETGVFAVIQKMDRVVLVKNTDQLLADFSWSTLAVMIDGGGILMIKGECRNCRNFLKLVTFWRNW